MKGERDNHFRPEERVLISNLTPLDSSLDVTADYVTLHSKITLMNMLTASIAFTTHNGKGFGKSCGIQTLVPIAITQAYNTSKP